MGKLDYQSIHQNSHVSEHVSTPNSSINPILTAHLYENGNESPIFLKSIAYPSGGEKHKTESFTSFFAANTYPDEDPFLPWIHDVFLSHDASKVHILAQNRRRCHTGIGMEHEMERLEPQIALFQPISLRRNTDRNKVKNYVLSNHDDASISDTRFICRFKLWNRYYNNFVNSTEEIVFSQYPYDYEYITWRKKMHGMFSNTGKDISQFWLSSLEFLCPVPREIMPYLSKSLINKDDIDVYLDVGTIRTPTRKPGEWFFHKNITDRLHKYFDVYESWGRDIMIPELDKSTRWENILIKTSSIGGAKENERTNQTKPFKIVACTWTSASHNRRGDAVTINDGRQRLQEWIAFHLIVGFDHIVVYDNSAANLGDSDNPSSDHQLKNITDQFGSQVTYVNWPPKICNNNRPAHNNPGERSSQYAAEASCRARFGPYTDWMTFLDPDEYLIPMGKNGDWRSILSNIDQNENLSVLKFRSSRARPRPGLMDNTYEEEYGCPSLKEVSLNNPNRGSCLTKKTTETFLKTYNCDYIKSPKPERFQRAMVSVDTI